MSDALHRELEALLVETNDQRRRVGQVLFHFYRSLDFWRERGRTFHQIARAWSPAGALLFRTMAGTLRRLSPHERDAGLRAYVASVLSQLADDLERGDHMIVPFLRWIEGRFPDLTQMMQQETPESRIYDYELARSLQSLFEDAGGADRDGFVERARRAALEIA